MTIVEVLCLNHGKYFPIVYTSDIFGELRFKICNKVNHRFFHFYGGTENREFLAWLYPMNALDEIKKHIEEKCLVTLTTTSLERIALFLEYWEFLANEKLYPEFFLSRPKEKGFNYEKIVKTNQSQDANLNEITKSILNKNNLLSEEPKEDSEKVEEQFNQLMEAAKKRYKSCVSCQSLNREDEAKFFDFLFKIQESPILEQKVLAIFALQYYQINQIKDSEKFIKFVEKGLKDDLYLIRKETFELLVSTFIFNPEIIFSFLEKLLKSKNHNDVLFGIKLLQEIRNILEAVLDNELLLTSIDFTDEHKLDTIYYSKLVSLFQLALEKQKEFLQVLLMKNAYWIKNRNWEKQLPKNILEYTEKDQLMFYSRVLNCLNIISRPFKLKKG